MKNKIILFAFCCCFTFATSAKTIIIKKNLKMEVNNDLQTRINSTFADAKPLVNNFSSSEYIETKYFTSKLFHLIKKEKKSINDAAGTGNSNKIEKILSIKTYNNFPDAVYISVQYINHSKKDLPVIKWVNSEYHLIPSNDSTKFWSFQGSSHADRRDWLQKVNQGFSEKNFMGMNASDYGGGIPVIDLWRRDAGIAIGNTTPVAKLISLPIDYDKYATTAKMSVTYVYPEKEILKPNDTLGTF